MYTLADGGCFVEKRTRSVVEYTLARAILADVDAGLPAATSMVRFLAAMPDPQGGYRLFMERLDGVGNNDRWLWGAEARLARTASAFSRAIDEMRQRHELTLRPAPDVFCTLTRALCGLESGTKMRLGTLQRALRGYPLIPAHNDLFWPNIGSATGSDALVFLDFALVGDNLPGADYHHFATGLTKSPQHRAFFHTVTELAAGRTGTPVEIVRVSACLNAAARACARETKRGKPKKGQRMALRFFNLAEEALQGRRHQI